MDAQMRKMVRSPHYQRAKDILLILVGCVLFAFGDAVFLNKWDIVSGGVSSLGIIVDYFVEPLTGFGIRDIVVAVAQVVLWILGLVFMGKKFALKTLVAMIAYPAFYALFYRLDLGTVLGLGLLYPSVGGASLSSYELLSTDVGNLMICAAIGGALDGVAVGMAFLGHASTGGFAIVSSILAKFTAMKEDVSSFLIDSVLILISALARLNQPSIGIYVLGGIISALVCSMAIQAVYINADRFVIADVISDQYEEIAKFVYNELDHSVTLFDAVGGYTGENRKMMRIVINKSEQLDLENKIAEIDPSAFVSFTKAKSINGEGFVPLPKIKKEKKHKTGDKEHD